VEVRLHSFLTSTPDGCRVIFTQRLLYSLGSTPCYHWTGDWVDSKAGLDALKKTSPPRNENTILENPANNLTTIPPTLSRISVFSIFGRQNEGKPMWAATQCATHYTRDAQIPNVWSSWRLNFVRRTLIFVGPQYGTYFSSLVTPRILRRLLDFFKNLWTLALH
jgi:hypothetical protein